ncbi:uncharacterized protein SOCEGT47_008390 [Sorangium cellulosum]|uniref:MAM domain-containing protein n=1 Tax=Sorangium cellulosum TaxID=56 RepID=A0A4P2PUT5_SORCE|nr:hypothetical protein [Sorangium cellulosum]AUX20370.1 uncharacterized protein SOCEGT47_008390 [Sorangium cellulosum]
MTSWIPWVLSAVALTDLGCSAASSAGSAGAGAAGGSGGAPASAVSSGGGGGSGGAPPCEIDCSLVPTSQCMAAVCNEATRECELVPSAGGEPCDDRDACTVGETCEDGVCQGGAQEDCGVTPDACHVVTCVDAGGAPRCGLEPREDGTPCVTDDRCVLNATCQGGVCAGTQRDCFFFQVPDSCHVGVCNPATGACEAVPGNEGQPCADSGDLCMVGKTCQGGRCEGGAPRDCSALSVGCDEGVCDPGSGNCYAEPIAPGGACLSGTDECNRGVCDEQGACISIPTPGEWCPSETVGCTRGVCSDDGVCTPRPVPDGGACVDSDWCTVGETCLAGVCQGGAAEAPTVYFRDTFESNAAGWELGPTWEIGQATSSSGHTYGHADPASDHTATSDNGVAGVVIGGNAPVSAHPYYYLTSPVVDAEFDGGVYLTYWRFLNSDEAPHMTNRVEVFDGARWVVLFESGSYPGVRDAAWKKVSHDLTPYKNASLRVRFGYAIGRDTFVDSVSSWNLDDVEIANAACP